METPIFLCDLCGLETHTPSPHLSRAHGMTLEEWITRAGAHEVERIRQEAYAATMSHLTADCDCRDHRT